MEVCRICLESERKLYSMAGCGLTPIFEHLMGFKVMIGDRMPQSVCAECGTRLLSMNKLKTKSEKAHVILCDILSKCFYISQDTIKYTDRQELKSNLNQKHTPTNQFDYEFNYIDSSHLLHTTIDMEAIEIKPETEDYFDESVGLIEANPINNTDSISESNDQEGYHSDSKSISSLDVPLQQLKIAKSAKVKEKSLKKKKKLTKKVKLKKKLIEPKIDKRRRPFLNGDLNESLFTITDLSFDEQMAEVLKRKDSLNYKNCVYKCKECFKGFLNEKAFSSHIYKHSNEAGSFRCEICKTRFQKSHALRKHITAHHNQLFSCNSCDYVTTHRQTARLHEKWHNGAKYQCPHCASEFTKFTTYMGHIRIKHPSDFVCELCGYSFISAKGIDLHKSLKHRETESNVVLEGPQCDACNVRFVSEEAYAKHLQVSARHKENNDARTNALRKQRKPRIPKDRASKEMKSKEQTERKHYKKQIKKSEGPIDCEQIHTGLKPFKCELCGKGFKHSSEKRAHHTYVHLKKPWPKRARRRDVQSAGVSGTDDGWPTHYTSTNE